MRREKRKKRNGFQGGKERKTKRKEKREMTLMINGHHQRNLDSSF
jgi:hypothetical protein